MNLGDDFLGSEHISPRLLKRMHLGLATISNFMQQMTEASVYWNQHTITRSNQADHHCFDA
ncbi:hypothetical protein D3C76_1882050 [compost metagenome]